uniref:Uncharacterized protein n=1 Tax=Meloidogyne enterolobii TaxID=390850 RepID=A0A6V7V7A0_MELEN|nr:unnamed protein product [Meloidogyne enterolobii]
MGVEKRENNVRDLIAFWIFGLANNFAYVIMLSAADDIIKSQHTHCYDPAYEEIRTKRLSHNEIQSR